MANKFRSTVIHSLGYYKKLILCVGQGLEDGLTHKEIVAQLNARDIPSTVGKPFTVGSLAQMLNGFRNPDAFPTNAYRAMLQLFFEGEISKAQCLPLLTKRAGTL